MVAQLETPSINSRLNLPYSVAGLVQVFTSPNRNFFTSVMAQALRIAGQGTPVLIVQFLKGGIRQGYDKPICMSQNLDWLRCDLPRCVDTPHLEEAEDQALQDLWQYTKQVVAEEKYSLILLDELSLAINFGFIPETEVLEFIDKRPPQIDMIFTGSEMPSSILDVADQITEIRRSHQP
ncbi:MAG: P-loop NTPase family protein [Sphaerospermopsis sp. SIO1G2]|nr:P-loop NTPase family protein [Sphaerospermopsis sp. SIO1G1]NET69539.1 P-loop NTPase family protein [Sphaerospermopsis sp. SIO1G2]